MKRATTALLLLVFAALTFGSPALSKDKLKVVGSIPDFAAVAKEIGGNRVEVASIAKGNQDPHFVLPKPSYALMLRDADIFITTGLDLELWAPTLIDKARNPKIVEGGPGYVSASAGLKLMEIPTRGVDRSAGDIHIYGNPHIQTSPINMKKVAENILIGLQKVDPEHADYYQQRYQRFIARMDSAMYGPELVQLLGSQTLDQMTINGTLIDFLKSQEMNGQKLIDKLGGWLKAALPFRGEKIISYHKNWEYFCRDFGLQIVDFVEPKPGIPPTAKHVKKVMDEIKQYNIRLMLVANSFEKHTPQKIEARTGVKAVFLP
ncbi:MAG TPA: zinc ABC transporter substrate-binding protein, partial [Bacteroidetes bacterium]|nr:zinc ABC transporter substrate-binding protein [Bacteroidota bacterium]